MYLIIHNTFNSSKCAYTILEHTICVPGNCDIIVTTCYEHQHSWPSLISRHEKHIE